jgi:hypothetical protein
MEKSSVLSTDVTVFIYISRRLNEVPVTGIMVEWKYKYY